MSPRKRVGGVGEGGVGLLRRCLMQPSNLWFHWDTCYIYAQLTFTVAIYFLFVKGWIKWHQSTIMIRRITACRLAEAMCSLVTKSSVAQCRLTSMQGALINWQRPSLWNYHTISSMEMGEWLKDTQHFPMETQGQTPTLSVVSHMELTTYYRSNILELSPYIYLTLWFEIQCQMPKCTWSVNKEKNAFYQIRYQTPPDREDISFISYMLILWDGDERFATFLYSVWVSFAIFSFRELPYKQQQYHYLSNQSHGPFTALGLWKQPNLYSVLLCCGNGPSLCQQGEVECSWWLELRDGWSRVPTEWS